MFKHAAEPPANSPPPLWRRKSGSLPAGFELLVDLAAEGARPLHPAAAQLLGFAGPVLSLFGQGAAADALERLLFAGDDPAQDDRQPR